MTIYISRSLPQGDLIHVYLNLYTYIHVACFNNNITTWSSNILQKNILCVYGIHFLVYIRKL